MRRFAIIALVLAVIAGAAFFVRQAAHRPDPDVSPTVGGSGTPSGVVLTASPVATVPPPPALMNSPGIELLQPQEKKVPPVLFAPERMLGRIGPMTRLGPAYFEPMPYAPPPRSDEWIKLNANDRLANTRGRLQPQLDAELSKRGLKFGEEAFIRIFKEVNEVELWLRPRGRDEFRLFRAYDTVRFSGVLGPKTKEGDMQAPEGFYSVAESQLNPASTYHLAFNIGYPNEYDRAHQRTGSLIMVHGSNVSIGCFAMTDPVIEEIFLIVEGALNNGQQRVPVHVFPFRMTEERMTSEREARDEWLGFWENLKEGHDAFEARKHVPSVSVGDGRYVFIP